MEPLARQQQHSITALSYFQTLGCVTIITSFLLESMDMTSSLPSLLRLLTLSIGMKDPRTLVDSGFALALCEHDGMAALLSPSSLAMAAQPQDAGGGSQHHEAPARAAVALAVPQDRIISRQESVSVTIDLMPVMLGEWFNCWVFHTQKQSEIFMAPAVPTSQTQDSTRRSVNQPVRSGEAHDVAGTSSTLVPEPEPQVDGLLVGLTPGNVSLGTTTHSLENTLLKVKF